MEEKQLQTPVIIFVVSKDPEKELNVLYLVATMRILSHEDLEDIDLLGFNHLKAAVKTQIFDCNLGVINLSRARYGMLRHRTTIIGTLVHQVCRGGGIHMCL